MKWKYVGLPLAWLLRGILLVSSLLYLYFGNYVDAIILLLSFGFALIPEIIRQMYGEDLHWIYDLLFSFLISGHMFGFMGLYERSLIYDDFLHISGSFILGIFGYSLIYAYNLSERIRVTLPFIFFFTVLWTIGVGAVWEIAEFMWDNIIFLSTEFGFAQDSLLDTMIDLNWDLIAGILAAMVMSSFCKRCSKKSFSAMFDPLVKLITRKFKKI